MSDDPDQDVVEFAYELTMESYVRFVAAAALDSEYIGLAKSYRLKMIRSSMVGVLSAAFAGGLLILSTGMASDAPEIWWVLGGGFGIVTAYVIVRSLPLAQRRRDIAQSTVTKSFEQLDPHMFGRVRFSANREVIEWGRELRSTRLPWSEVVEFNEAAGFTMLVCADRTGPIFPPGSMSVEQLAMLRSLFARHAGGKDRATQIVASLLADRSFTCPACGYDCRGLRHAVCPECARPITLDDLKISRGDVLRIVDEACWEAGIPVKGK
ncbi:MAG: hypothetical protein H6810_04035 [Phycisphaeraceae bacterium]|nr:MAG: hypothetical protein H6810_04035 [Phycisphaeraceae bacterium]